MNSNPSFTFRELQQICTSNKEKLPEGSVCRGSGVTKLKLTKMLYKVGLVSEDGKRVQSQQRRTTVSKKSGSHIIEKTNKKTETKQRTFRELQAICTSNKEKLPEGSVCRGKGITTEKLYQMLLKARLLDAGTVTKESEKIINEPTRTEAIGKAGTIKRDQPKKKAPKLENGQFFINNAVCASANAEIPIESLFLGQTACNRLSERIANTLVTVASSRIFSNPYRALLELPINSIDAYRSMKANSLPSVGKFGMGFFSIFYYVFMWKARVQIESNYMDKEAYSATVGLVDGKLSVEYQLLKTQDFQRGTKITIFPHIAFDAEQEEGFLVALEYLLDIPDTSITIDVHRNPRSEYQFTDNYEYGPGTEKSNANISPANQGWRIYFVAREDKNNNYPTVNIKIDNTAVSVRDHATGISQEAFFKYLLSPSVSTKTISAEMGLVKNLKSTKRTRIVEQHSSISPSILYITVNGIVVIKTELRDRIKDSVFLISLPAGISLPVSRDNIIITEETRQLVFDEFKALADLVVERNRDVTAMFQLFDAVDQKTTTTRELSIIINETKRYVYAMDHIFTNSSSFAESEIYSHIKLKKGQKVVRAPRYDIGKLEELISRTFEGVTLDNILVGKKVVPLPKILVAFNANLPSFIFIPKSYLKLKQSTWVERVMGGFSNDNLKVVKKGGKQIATPQKALVNVVNLIEQFSSYSNVYLLENYTYDILKGDFSRYVIGEGVIGKAQTECLKYLYNELSSLNLVSPYGNKSQLIVNYIPGKVSSVIVLDSSIANLSPPREQQLGGLVSLEDAKKFPSWMFDKLLELGIELSLWALQRSEYRKTVEAIVQFFDPTILVYYALIFVRTIRSVRTEIIANALDVFIHPLELLIFFQVVLEANLWDKTTRGLTKEVMQQYSLLVNENFTFASIVEYTTYGKLHPLLESVLLTPLSAALNSLIITKVPARAAIKEIPDTKRLISAEFLLSDLLEVVFQSDTDSNFMEVAKDAETLGNQDKNAKNTTLTQIIEIAINEGTSKNFISAVFTELIQNSVDAYRTVNDPKASVTKKVVTMRGKKRIEIEGDRSGITLTDFVGIAEKHLFGLLIPFLSSKDPKDILTTGEMGTGLFNIYRQPYTQQVQIRTSGPDGTFYIVASPIIKMNRVVDLKYKVVKDPQITKNRFTTTLIDFHKFENERTGVKLETEMNSFVNSALRTMDIDFSWNRKSTGKVYTTEIYSSDKISVDRVGIVSTSYIYSNGIPVGPLHNVKDSSTLTSDSSFPLIYTGYKLNLKSGSYIPTQGRVELQLNDDMRKEIDNGIYYAILHALLHEDVGVRSLYMKNYRSKGNYNQIIPHGGYITNYAPIGGMSINRAIAKTAENLKGREPTVQLIRKVVPVMTPVQRKLVDGWFSGKTWDSAKIVREKDKKKVTVPFIVRSFMSKFTKKFWEYGLSLEKKGELEGTGFNRHKNAPRILFDDIPERSGEYNTKKHLIKLNHDLLEGKLLEKNIVSFLKAKNKLSALKEGKALFALIRNVPGGVLIHELTHAWATNSPLHSYHRDQSLMIAGAKKDYDFEIAGAKVFSLMLERGFMDDFAKILDL